MLRDDAVLRINRGLGFLAPGHTQTNDIIQCLQEAQRDLERGKTIPWFLKVEDQPLVLPVNEHVVQIPETVLRPDDENPISYVAPDSQLRRYLVEYRDYREAVLAIQSVQRPDQPQVGTDVPSVYVFRTATIDFITRANATYNFTWSYYESDEVLTINIENLWLKYAPEWLIGEAGRRMAMDKRDTGAVQLFTDMMQKGRMAIFADDIAWKDSGGPIAMGSNL